MFSKFHNRQKGFTLIEHMIVVVIIGILAALAIPRFMSATTRARQAECKGILKQVYTMEQTQFQEHGFYLAAGPGSAALPNGLSTIGVIIAPTARYAYVVTAPTVTTFVATATANIDDDAVIDTWTIDQTGTLAPTAGLDDVYN